MSQLTTVCSCVICHTRFTVLLFYILYVLVCCVIYHTCLIDLQLCILLIFCLFLAAYQPENILLDDNHNIKVSDFGFATILQDGEKLTGKCG